MKPIEIPTTVPGSLLGHAYQGCISSSAIYHFDERLYRAWLVARSQCTHLQQLLLQSLMQGQACVESANAIQILLHARHGSQDLNRTVPTAPADDIRCQGRTALRAVTVGLSGAGQVLPVHRGALTGVYHGTDGAADAVPGPRYSTFLPLVRCKLHGYEARLPYTEGSH